jgi:UDP-glucose 4-epimerase
LARALGVAPLLIPVPVRVLRLVGPLTGREATIRRLIGSLQVDDSLLRSRLGWVPPFEVDQGLAETARWYQGLSRARPAASA